MPTLKRNKKPKISPKISPKLRFLQIENGVLRSFLRTHKIELIKYHYSTLFIRVTREQLKRFRKLDIINKNAPAERVGKNEFIIELWGTYSYVKHSRFEEGKPI